jgi:hypothetical protein
MTAKDDSDTPNRGAPASAPAVPKELLHGLHGTVPDVPKETATLVEDADGTPTVTVDAAKPEATPETASTEPGVDENPQTDKAVDEIIAGEGDEVLAAEDAARANQPMQKRTFGQKLGHFFGAWWGNKWARWCTIIGVLLALGVTLGIPTSRYAVLNAVGVRSSVGVTILDDSTALPLKNVQVQIGDSTATTDINGNAKMQHVRLGKQQMTIKRIAFAPVAKTIVVGWGSNPLGNFSLHAVGMQYTIVTTDYVSGKPLAKIEAASGDADAISDNNGKITLTVDNESGGDVPVTLKANGYRTEQITLKAATQQVTKIQMVNSRKEVFISKQSGKYDLYKVDLDGQNKQVLLAGTGLETNNIALVANDADSEVALVSTRDNMRDQDGFLLSALTLVNVSDGTILTIDHAEQIQLVDWIGNRIVYTAASAGASAANSQRYRLMSFDYVGSKRSQLASANQFNTVLSAQGKIYFAVSSTDPKAQAYFFRVNPDNTSRQTILSQEVWSAFRADYGTLNLQTPSGWFSYALDGSPQKLASAPPLVSRSYIDSADGKQSLWVDTRDGQGVLLAYDTSAKKDKTIQTQTGLTYPVEWLDGNTIVYRVSDQQSSADYVVSLQGAAAKKVTDVTNTYGFSQAY